MSAKVRPFLTDQYVKAYSLDKYSEVSSLFSPKRLPKDAPILCPFRRYVGQSFYFKFKGLS